MSVATETVISIDDIEEEMSKLGLVTEYYGDDDRIEFTISVGDKEVRIVDGVSGDYFTPENVTYAEYSFGVYAKDVTEEFADVESIYDFVYRVKDALSISFIPR